MIEIGLVIATKNARLINYLDVRRLLLFGLRYNIYLAKFFQPRATSLPSTLSLDDIFHAPCAVRQG